MSIYYTNNEQSTLIILCHVDFIFLFFILYMKHLISKEALFTFLPFYFFTVFLPPLILLPEGWCEDHEYGKDFQTADEHHERTEPLGQVGQFAP